MSPTPAGPRPYVVAAAFVGALLLLAATLLGLHLLTSVPDLTPVSVHS